RVYTLAGYLEALDARGTDNRLRTVGEADERLALPVIVGRPDDDRGVVALDTAHTTVLGIEPPPKPHERVLFPLAFDGGLVGVPGEHAQMVWERHEHVHDRPA